MTDLTCLQETPASRLCMVNSPYHLYQAITTWKGLLPHWKGEEAVYQAEVAEL